MVTERRAKLIESLARTPTRVAELLESLPDRDTTRKPSADAFSARELVHHLRDIETHGWAPRLARILSETDPALPGVDGARLAKEGHYNARAHAPAFDELTRLRGEAVARLEKLDDESWNRNGRLEGVGMVDLEGLLDRWLAHDTEHLAELEALCRPGG